MPSTREAIGSRSAALAGMPDGVRRGQLPAEVVGVLHTGVESLPSGRRVHVGGVTGEECPPGPEALREADIRAPDRCPRQLAQPDVGPPGHGFDGGLQPGQGRLHPGRRGVQDKGIGAPATLGLWRWSQGTVSVSTVSTPKVEAFYWATITFSQTLGTALGDWLADTRGFGYERGALVFAAGLAVVVALYYWTGVSRVTLFWVAFILTRPLGATVGDFIDKPVADGGLALSRPLASAVIAAVIVALLIVLPQRPGGHPRSPKGKAAEAAAE